MLLAPTKGRRRHLEQRAHSWASSGCANLSAGDNWDLNNTEMGDPKFLRVLHGLIHCVPLNTLLENKRLKPSETSIFSKIGKNNQTGMRFFCNLRAGRSKRHF